MKILFFGTSNYCLPVLETLHKNFDLVGVITLPKSPIEQFTLSHNIKVFTPNNKSELLSLKENLETLRPDLAIIADYGMIIPKEIFYIPSHQTLNIHFSKLPKYRGPSPVQYTILEGNKSAWITVILMDEGMDTGDILWCKEVQPLDGSETTPELYRKLFSIAANELPGVIDKFLLKKLKPLKQSTSGVSYTKSFTRKDGFIPHQVLKNALKGKAATKIERELRAFSPWPGLWTIINIPQPKRFKILKAHIESTTNDQRPATTLVLDAVQLEGKRPVTWKQFLEGYPDAKIFL